MKEWFDSLDAKTKGIVVIIAIILTIYILSTAKSYAKHFLNTADDTGEIAALKSKGMSPSFSKSEYNTFANQLERAMAGPNLSHDTELSILKKLENDIDFISLEKAFGIRSFWGSGGDLTAWVTGDFDRLELLEINEHMAKKGITKQF
ncbi:hypothetical protein [Brumimicrobium mesophilum]|uniref:hypothetical protein n=1 Tax=Brumimicrobium mesophilum TaxID=392717 RepID=UPI000D142861|nr:hypothetical protein [Brumimicrobium mesophilum]